jgi:cobalt-zinc-cadmium efflux system membrane fusion protein
MIIFPSSPLILAVALLSMNVGCKRSSAEDTSSAAFVLKDGRFFIPENSSLRSVLQVQSVEETIIEASFSVSASVEADPTDVVKLHAPMPGRIVKVHVRLGDSVAAGQALITIDSSELTLLNAEYQQAKTAERQAKREFDRLSELFMYDIVSKRELEEAETEYSSQQSVLKQAEVRLNQLDVQPGDIVGGLLVLRSPIAGKVSELSASKGSYRNDEGEPLMVVVNLKNVYLTANVQERDIPRLFPGQQVRVSVNSFPGEVFNTRVVSTGETLDPETRTVKVRMPIENPRHRLLPSMYATADFGIKPYAGIMIPVSAVIHDANGSKVFVESSPWSFEERMVQTGVENSSQVGITSGLSVGERIVTREGVLLHAN